MRSLHLTILIFCHVLLASFILYSQYTLASPVVQQPKSQQQQQQPQQPIDQSIKNVENDLVESKQPQQYSQPELLSKPVVEKQQVVEEAKKEVKPLESVVPPVVVAAPTVIEHVVPSQNVQKEAPVEPSKQVQVVAAAPLLPSKKVVSDTDYKVVPVVASVSKVVDSPSPSGLKSPPVSEDVKKVVGVKEEPAVVRQQESQVVPVPVAAATVPVAHVAPVVPVASVVPEVAPVQEAPKEQIKKVLEAAPVPAVPEPQKLVGNKVEQEMSEKKAIVPEQPVQVTAEKQPNEKPVVSVVQSAPPKPVVEEKVVVPAAEPRVPVVVPQSPLVQKNAEVLSVPVPVSIKSEQPGEPTREIVSQKNLLQAPVKGGLGPLHLLASSLCSYQPERLVADENLNLLYKERAAIRKSLFDFMSLKFTNLEKLSSRLNPGYASLEVVPPKKVDHQAAKEGVVPSHGWPVVGVCTAHDLKLMAEAAWCDSSVPPQQQSVQQQQPSEQLGVDKPQQQQPVPQQAVASPSSPNQARAQSNRSLKQQQQNEPQVANDQHSAVISKMLHVNDIKDAPVIENSLAGLNLTQQQLVSIQAQATSTRECRRNALRLTKALFNHLAEDQKNESESWPKLYSHLADDECARKRMIDVVTALAGFRGESTSIRRDNVEYAFAMDDLRTKVLESEINVPLTFDKQFIEVEQFLQQSVKLMLANIDPGRARLTSMRYRSLMPGPVAADDQCIELHQRLLAKNYPTDCNPTQFGQLPDVLRMAASSLALWSIETELNKYSSRVAQVDYQTASQPIVAQPQVKQDVHECIANLVSA